ncbi:MAG: hypothetical protein QOF02_1462 [Blastocatellia bacterium]|jgi:hypothetical protein|nr:hypothetical protein [Blastocatellia bacterium]
MPKVQFSVKLEAVEQGGVFFTLPRKESAKFGVRGRVPVTGTINGVAFRSSIFPTGDGGHFMGVRREWYQAAGAEVGDKVKVLMETDDAPRTVTIPPDLDAQLAKSIAARVRFDKLSYTQRKEYAQWIEAAKRPETRVRRLKQVMDKLTTEQS